MRLRGEQTTEELYVMDEIGGKCSSAAKADIHSVGSLRGLKPPPPSELSFSVACEARPEQIIGLRHD